MKYPFFIKRLKHYIDYYLIRFIRNKNYRDECDIILKYFATVSKPKFKVMFDVGAHMGEVSYNFLKSGFKVYAFEPDQSEYKRKSLQRLMMFKGFSLSPCAASNKSGEEIDFYTSNISSGISSAIKFHDSHIYSGKVKTIALRDYISNTKIEGIDFIKIDTEGYDYFVLQGLDLAKIKPLIIICEYENKKSENLQYKLQDMLNYLTKYGYKNIISEWYPIEHYGSKHTWKQFIFYPDLPNENSWGNIIAVHPIIYDVFLPFIEKIKIK
jgi:FkbM family methyltransferase